MLRYATAPTVAGVRQSLKSLSLRNCVSAVSSAVCCVCYVCVCVAHPHICVEFDDEVVGGGPRAEGEYDDAIYAELLDRLETLRAQVLAELKDGEVIMAMQKETGD